MPRRDVMPMAAPFAFGLIAMFATLAAHAQPRTFGNWIVGCDNKAECTAVGTMAAPPNPAGPAVVLRIGVDRTSPGGFEFAVIPLPDGNPTPRAITVICSLCSNGLRTAGEDIVDRFELHGQRLTIPDREAARWLDALGKGQRIAVAWTGSAASVTIDASTFLEAWKFLAQSRGDLMRQALIGAGLPSPQVGPPREERRRALSAREVVPSGIPGIERMGRICSVEADQGRYRQFELPGGVTLWAVECRKGDTLTRHWYQARSDGDLPTALELPDGDRVQLNAGETSFAESVFDFDFGILRARSGPAGREDCGTQRAWGWDGGSWFLLERREMPVCVGLSPSDWIRTYASP